MWRMQRTAFGAMTCSIARTLNAAGEPWSPLIVRDVFVGINRFDQLQRDLGISRKVLTERLQHLVAEQILERVPYSQQATRHEYRLTTKGLEFCEVVFAMMAWGDRWTAGSAGPPAVLRHETCGELTQASVTCAQCGQPLHAVDVHAEPGPGGSDRPGTALMGKRLAGDA
jgi:DNA-binding HxlR family transcriptional regulator